jgi:hypothetical protein
LAAKVIKEPTPLANHHEQATAPVVITFVKPEMLRQMVDSLGEQSHLHFGRPGVAFAMAEFNDNFLSGLHDARNLKSVGTRSV